MLFKRTITTAQWLQFFVGLLRAEGNDGAGSAGSAVFTSAAADFVTDGVAAGDVVYIDGEGEFEVATRDSANQLTLDGILSQNLVDVSYRVTHSRVISDYDSQVKDIAHDGQNGSWTIIYDVEPPSFTVS
jgi:hypothetical protein